MTKLTEVQYELYELIDDICFDGYSKNPDDSLSYEIWKIFLSGKDENFGHIKIEEVVREKLKSLVEICNGWIRFDENNNEYFVPLHQLQERFIPLDQVKNESVVKILTNEVKTEYKISLIEKKQFLLWLLKRTIENDTRELYNLASNIIEDPKGSWSKLHHYHSETLNKHLVQLNFVQNDTDDNINAYFERYVDFYSEFLSLKQDPKSCNIDSLECSIKNTEKGC